MRSIISTGIIAATAILGLTACSSGSSDTESSPTSSATVSKWSSPAPATATTQAGVIEPLEVSKNPAFTDDENFYLSYLKRFNVPIPNEKSMVELGHSICDLLRYSDDDYAKVAMTIARESEGTFTVDDATTMTGAVKGGGLCG